MFQEIINFYENKILNVYIDTNIIETFDDGEPKLVSSLILDSRIGLVKAEDSYVSDKTGNRVSTKQKIKRDFITDDIDKIITKILGEGATIEDTNSFETIWKRINHEDFPYPNKIEDIKEYFLNVLEDINKSCERNDRPTLTIHKELK